MPYRGFHWVLIYYDHILNRGCNPFPPSVTQYVEFFILDNCSNQVEKYDCKFTNINNVYLPLSQRYVIHDIFSNDCPSVSTFKFTALNNKIPKSLRQKSLKPVRSQFQQERRYFRFCVALAHVVFTYRQTTEVGINYSATSDLRPNKWVQTMQHS